jgi:hypothetical protein
MRLVPHILFCTAIVASAIAEGTSPQGAPTPPSQGEPTPPSPRPEAVTKETSSGPQSQTFSEPDAVGI